MEGSYLICFKHYIGKGKVGWPRCQKLIPVQRVQQPESTKHQKRGVQTTFILANILDISIQKPLNQFQKIQILTNFYDNQFDLINILISEQILQCSYSWDSMPVDMQLVILDNKIVLSQYMSIYESQCMYSDCNTRLTVIEAKGQLYTSTASTDFPPLKIVEINDILKLICTVSLSLNMFKQCHQTLFHFQHKQKCHLRLLQTDISPKNSLPYQFTSWLFHMQIIIFK